MDQDRDNFLMCRCESPFCHFEQLFLLCPCCDTSGLLFEEGIRLLLLSLMVGGKNVVTGEGKRKDSGKINGEAVGEEYNQLMKRKD